MGERVLSLADAAAAREALEVSAVRRLRQAYEVGEGTVELTGPQAEFFRKLGTEIKPEDGAHPMAAFQRTPIVSAWRQELGR